MKCLRRISLGLALVLILIGLLFEVQPLVTAKYYYPRPWGPFITFNSPANSSYKGGTGFTLTLDISVGVVTGAPAPDESYELTYSLDGQPYKSLPVVYEGVFQEYNSMSHSVYTGRTYLPSLSEGSHTIAAHCILRVDNSIFTAEDKVIFSVDNTPPQVLILTLENKTYGTTNLPLNFTVNGPCSLAYCLDGKEEVQIEGNATLTGLTSGSHNLTVYARDIAGNSGSETIYFSIAEPFPIVTMLIVVAIIISMIVFLLIYIKRHKDKLTSLSSQKYTRIINCLFWLTNLGS